MPKKYLHDNGTGAFDGSIAGATQDYVDTKVDPVITDLAGTEAKAQQALAKANINETKDAAQDTAITALENAPAPTDYQPLIDNLEATDTSHTASISNLTAANTTALARLDGMDTTNTSQDTAIANLAATIAGTNNLASSSWDEATRTLTMTKADGTVTNLVIGDQFLELIDNLTTDDATKAGSAKQLKVLNDKITDLHKRTDHGVFLKAALPVAGVDAGDSAYVTDLADGAMECHFDGSAWRQATDRKVAA